MDEEQELKRLKQKKDNQEITEDEYEIEKTDVEDRDRLLFELKQQLENGEIDGATYNKLSYKIINRSKEEEKIIEDFENKKSHASSRIRIYFKAIVTLTIICIVVFGIIGIFEEIRAAKISGHIITDIDKRNLPEPIQGLTTGEMHVKIDGTDIRIEKLASYTIYGKVVAIHNYTLKNDLYDKLSPVDFTIAYGEGIEIAERLNITTNSDRMAAYRPKNESDYEWFNKNYELIRTKLSNNHLIHANDEIRDLLLQVRVGDYVKLKGYLVGVYSDQRKPWVSSLSRDDNYHFYMNPSADKDSSACEIMYVTEINWLE